MESSKLRVMSWNIGQIYTPKLPVIKWVPFFNKGVVPNRYLPLIASTIWAVRPHIVCLQEVRKSEDNPDRGDQLEILEKKLRGKYVGYYGPSTNEGEHRAFLIKQKLVKNSQFKLEDIMAEAAGVGFAAYLPKKQAWIANLHLEHFDVGIRQKQLQSILAWIKSKRDNVIMTGDYNMRKTMHFTERYKKQVHEFFSKLQQKYKFRNASKNFDKTHLTTSQLDYFFTNLPQKMKEKTFVLKDKRWWFMDHYPIVGEFFAPKNIFQKAMAKAAKKKFAFPR